MTLEKAMTQKHLTRDTVDAQFCSDWLKGEIRLLMEQNRIMKAALEAAECVIEYDNGNREVFGNPEAQKALRQVALLENRK